MHEYPITLEIIRLAEKAAREQQADGVTKVSLVIGDLSGYVGDSIRLYFDAIAKGTLCEGCELAIRRIAPKVKCADCGHLFSRAPFSFSCPICGGEAHPTTIGSEFYIDYIEVKNTSTGSEDNGD